MKQPHQSSMTVVRGLLDLSNTMSRPPTHRHQPGKWPLPYQRPMCKGCHTLSFLTRHTTPHSSPQYPAFTFREPSHALTRCLHHRHPRRFGVRIDHPTPRPAITATKHALTSRKPPDHGEDRSKREQHRFRHPGWLTVLLPRRPQL